MDDTLTPQPARPPHERAAPFDLPLEQLALTLQRMRQASASLHDLEGRLTTMTAECAGLLEQWASHEAGHEALVFELRARLAEWNDVERRLLHESSARIRQAGEGIEHEWEALRQVHDPRVQPLDGSALRMLEACLTAVEEALRRFELGEARLGAVEEQLRRGLDALPREVRETVAQVRQGLTPAGLAEGTSGPAPLRRAWGRVSTIAAGVLMAALLGYTAYLHSRLESGLREAGARADAAERAAGEMRAALTTQAPSAGAAADERATRAADLPQQTQMLAAILAAADLRRLELVTAAGRGQRAAQVLLSRSSGISFSAARLDAPPPGSAYQLWLLTPDAATSIGTLPASAGGRTLATFAPAAPLPRPIVGASVTIEPAGGSRTPTGSVYLRTAVAPRPSPGSPPAQPPTQ